MGIASPLRVVYVQTNPYVMGRLDMYMYELVTVETGSGKTDGNTCGCCTCTRLSA